MLTSACADVKHGGFNTSLFEVYDDDHPATTTVLSIALTPAVVGTSGWKHIETDLNF
jgi:hypothetical protein